MGIVFLPLLLAQFEPEPRFGAPFAFPFRMAPTDHIGRKDRREVFATRPGTEFRRCH